MTMNNGFQSTHGRILLMGISSLPPSLDVPDGWPLMLDDSIENG